MSNINLNTKCIFVHVPKTGGTSMSNVSWNKVTYYNYYGHYSIKDFSEMVDVSKYFKWCFVRNPWSRLLSGYDHSLDFKNTFSTFEGFVNALYKHKNTYQKLDYNWSKIIEGIPELPKTSPEMFLTCQKAFLTVDGKVNMNFIGRYEKLQTDWIILCSLLKNKKHKPIALDLETWVKELDSCKIPHERNRKTESHSQYSSKPWQEYYTKEMIDLVGEVYEQDIKEFNYKFE